MKRKIKIVTNPIPGNNQATRVKSQGRFVIGTDASRDKMIVFKSVKKSKSIPNLFDH